MKYARYFRINMENFYDELANTALEIAKRLGIEVNEDFIKIFDEGEFEKHIEMDSNFTVFYHIDEENYFGFSIEKKHMQYNFDTDIMYGFFEDYRISVSVDGDTSYDDNKWVIVGGCAEIHNSVNYIK